MSTAKRSAGSGAASGPAPLKVTILGTGQMGIVCALLLTGPAAAGSAGRPPVEVVLWGHSTEETGGLTQTRRSPRLQGVILPDSVAVTADLARALERATVVVSAIPVQFSREVWKQARSRIPARTGVVSVAKGIENDSLLRPTQIVADALSDDPDGAPRPLAVLSGPTIATELSRGLPATMIAASDRPEFARSIQGLFATSFLRVYTSEDVAGVELAGAMKNVIAIAAGVLDGLQAGNNAKSALLARGLAEITRLGVALGASSATFFGIAGVGDLATSCFSPEGRNRSCGEALGRGSTLKEYLGRATSVVEGVATTRSVVALADKMNVDMPITRAVHAVLFEGVDPIDAISRLMAREAAAERVG